MIFRCPICDSVICSGLSRREFIIIDNEYKLEGMMLCHCPNCNNKIRLHIEGMITKATPVPEGN